MNLEPQKFFVGLMDFFSILLPGALLTYLLMDGVGPVILGSEKYQNLTGAEGWAAFLAASYLFGHLVFLLGSWLDELYDWIRRYTLNTQILLLARRGKLLPWPQRAVVWLVFKHERNLAVDRAGRIKQQALDPLHAGTAINTFQWCKAFLMLESPESLANVQRHEADSKFFRCFAVVLLVVIGMSAYQERWPLMGIAAALVPLALWRYMEQRFKATNQAYWCVITLVARSGRIALARKAPAAKNLTHAGGVVFRTSTFGPTEYLLVEASKDPSQWVLPKGHIDEGEHPRESAIREVHEETGVWARIQGDLNRVSYTVDGTVITVQYYLMEAVARGKALDTDRGHLWMPLDEAIKQASFLETRELLQTADQRRGTKARLAQR